jgi:hypothetical protein
MLGGVHHASLSAPHHGKSGEAEAKKGEGSRLLYTVLPGGPRLISHSTAEHGLLIHETTECEWFNLVFELGRP